MSAKATSERPDGYVVHPGTPQPGTVATYEDHRMAMAFALLGLVLSFCSSTMDREWLFKR